MAHNRAVQKLPCCAMYNVPSSKASNKVATFQSHVPILIDGPSGEDWRQACNPELVISWSLQHHGTSTPMALYAMEQGLHAASKCPSPPEDCIELVRTSERTKRHCIMLENCCYNGEELWLLNMVKQGVFGDVTHAIFAGCAPL